MSSKPQKSKSGKGDGKASAKPAAPKAVPAKAAPAKPALAKPASAKIVPSKAGLSKSEINEFVALLNFRRKKLQGDVESLEKEGMKKGSDAAGDLSTLPMHLADLGTDSFEQEMSLGLMETEGDELNEIQEAYDRIKDGTFGLCETCKKKIPKERLKAIPYTRLCVNCKKKEEGV